MFQQFTFCSIKKPSTREGFSAYLKLLAMFDDISDNFELKSFKESAKIISSC